MKHVPHAITALLVLIAAPAALTMAAPQNSDEGDQEVLVSRVYRVNHMDPGDALMLAHQTCLDRRGDRNSCRHEVERHGWFIYNTDARTQEAIAAALSHRDVPVSSLTLRLTLLMADNTDRPQVRLGKSETAALSDIRQLLPYRGFRVLETGQLLAQKRGQIRLGGLPFFTAEFRLEDWDGRDGSTIQFEYFELQRTSVVRPHTGDADHSAGGDDSDPRTFHVTQTESMLQTSFGMAVGETVVVGTSRLNGGDEALIVLLTATR